MINAFGLFDITGKNALVTGGSDGLGFNMARALALSGANVMISARRETLLKEASEKLREVSACADVSYCQVDLADRDSVENLAVCALKQYGNIDIFVGNASMFSLEPIEEIRDLTFDQMMQVNVGANVALFRAFLPGMRKQKWGRVVLSSSVSAERGSALKQNTSSMYCTVKGALDSFARAAAAEVGRDGITVNSIVLGSFLTYKWHNTMAQMDEEFGPGAGQTVLDSNASMTALGRIGTCEEVQGLIQLLASDAGSYLTGANIVLDGGLSVLMSPAPV